MPVINAPVSIRAWKGIAPSFALVAVAMSRNSERADQPRVEVELLEWAGGVADDGGVSLAHPERKVRLVGHIGGRDRRCR